MGLFSQDYVTMPCIEGCEASRWVFETSIDYVQTRLHRSKAGKDVIHRRPRPPKTLRPHDDSQFDPPSPSDNDASNSPESSGMIAAIRASARPLSPVQTISASAPPMLRRPMAFFCHPHFAGVPQTPQNLVPEPSSSSSEND